MSESNENKQETSGPEKDLRRWCVEMAVPLHGQNPTKDPVEIAKSILEWVKYG